MVPEASNVRKGAAETLGLIGRDAKDSFPALWSLARDPDSSVRKAASEAIQKIGQKATTSN